MILQRFAMNSSSYNVPALLVLAVSLAGCASYSAQSRSTKGPVTPQETSSSAGSDNSPAAPPLKLPLINPRLEVWKAERKLLLFSDEKVVRNYHVGLGLSPVRDKVRSGDHRTPEGEFYIFIKNPKSAFYLSLGISWQISNMPDVVCAMV